MPPSEWRYQVNSVSEALKKPNVAMEAESSRLERSRKGVPGAPQTPLRDEQVSECDSPDQCMSSAELTFEHEAIIVTSHAGPISPTPLSGQIQPKNRMIVQEKPKDALKRAIREVQSTGNLVSLALSAIKDIL